MVTSAVHERTRTARKTGGITPASAMHRNQERDMRFWMVALLGGIFPTIAIADPTSRPIVGELFTSEGCSSCPPADAKIAELARTRNDLLLLTFHVTYWNRIGWQDPYSCESRGIHAGVHRRRQARCCRFGHRSG
jgi:hypothetical protein